MNVRVYFAGSGEIALEHHPNTVVEIIGVSPNGKIPIRGQIVTLQRGDIRAHTKWEQIPGSAAIQAPTAYKDAHTHTWKTLIYIV